MSDMNAPAPTPAAAPAGDAKPQAAAEPKADAQKNPRPAQPDAAQAKAEPKADAKPEPKEPPRRHKVKVDGEELEIDEDELRRGYTHSRAAAKRMEEAAKLRKQAEDFVETLRKDPLKILGNPKLGINMRQIAEEFLAKELRKEVDPEGWQREQAETELKSKAQKYEEWERQQAEAAEKEQVAALERQYTEQYDKMLTDVLNTSGLPKTKSVVKRAAELMQIAVSKGYEPDVSHIVDMVREEYMEDVKSLLGALDGEMLVKLLGDETANKIRKWDLGRLRSPTPKGDAPKSEEPRERKQAQQKRLNPREFLAEAMKRAGV